LNATLVSVGAFASTFCGGLFALRFRGRLHFMLSLSAGVLLGVVSFDILPEIFELAKSEGIDPTVGMVALVTGFMLFHAMERLVLIHHANEGEYAAHHHPRVGVLSALALAGHSFMDGVGIGLGFQVSTTVGIAVAIAVIAHDFCDGLNTVSLMLVHRNSDSRSWTMLIVDAAAPVLGAASTLAFSVPPAILVTYLGLFAGFLLYIATADILPEAHSQAGAAKSTGLMVTTAAGAAAIFLAVRVAG
jgi:zinc transporter ZupT